MPYYDITIMAQAWCPFIHESKLLQIMFMPHFDANYFIDKLLADIGSQTWDIDLNNSVSNYETMYDLKLQWLLRSPICQNIFSSNVLSEVLKAPNIPSFRLPEDKLYIISYSRMTDKC